MLLCRKPKAPKAPESWVRLKVSGKSRQSGSKLHAVQTLARAPKLPDFAERLDCVKLASAFESERLSDTLNRPLQRRPYCHLASFWWRSLFSGLVGWINKKLKFSLIIGPTKDFSKT